MAGFFFRARRGPALACGILFAVFALFFAVALPSWLSVGTGNPAGETVTALTRDKEVRDEAARFFVEKLTEDAPTDDLALFDELEETITTKLDELVENEEFMSKVDGISDEIYDFLVDGRYEKTIVDAKAVAEDVVKILTEVDPDFADLQQNLDEWEGLALEPIEDAPDINALKNALNIVFWTALVLSVVTGTLYARWSRSKKGALAFIGSTFAVLGVVDLIAAGSVRSAVVSAVDEDDRLANAIAPVAADSLLSPFRTVGVTLLIIGLAGLAGSTALTLRARRA